MALRPLRKAYRFWLTMKYAYPNTRTHTHTDQPTTQPNFNHGFPRMVATVASRRRTLEYPMAHWPCSGSRAVSSRCKWVVSASRWDLKHIDHWKSWTISALLGSWKGWKWYMPQFFGGYRSFRRLQCSMSGGNKSILPVWVRIRYPKLLSLLQDRPNLAVVYLHLSKPLWVPPLE